MNILNKIFSLVFIVMLIGIMIGYRSCNNIKQDLEASELKYDNLTNKFDSILSLPADTIVLDPVVIKKDSLIYITRWKNKPLKNVPKDYELYKDSIINEEVDVRIQVIAKDVYSIDYAYKPIFRYQEKIIEKKIPYEVQVIKEVKIPQVGLYFQAGLGYSDQFSGKIGLMYLTKKKSSYSYDFVRYGSKNIHLISYGIKF